MSDLKKRIYDVIKKPILANFATITEDGKPWTRYIIMMGDQDLKLRFSTFTAARKVAQINNNPEVHITCGITDMEKDKYYLQIQGTAKLATDPQTKQAFWNDEIASYFTGPDDPNYGVIIVTPYRIEFNSMDSFENEVWQA